MKTKTKTKTIALVLAGVLLSPPVKADPVSEELWRARAESIQAKAYAEYELRLSKARAKAAKRLRSSSAKALLAYNQYDLDTDRLIRSEVGLSRYGVHYYGMPSEYGETKARLR
jgi:hypothetical protein